MVFYPPPADLSGKIGNNFKWYLLRSSAAYDVTEKSGRGFSFPAKLIMDKSSIKIDI
jgi:hypothetical protein